MYTEDSPPQSHAYEELVEVVTRAVERLNIDWLAEREDVQKADLTNASCSLAHNLNAGDWRFFPGDWRFFHGRNRFLIEFIVHEHHTITLY